MGLTQPGRYFLGLKRQFTRTKIAVEQLRNFFSRARLSDLIQRPAHMFFKAAVRLWYLSKVRLWGLKVSLMGAAHTVRNVKGAPEPQGSQWQFNRADYPRHKIGKAATLVML